MSHHVLAVAHAVADAESAAAFLCRVLDFVERESAAGWISVENGALRIRLVEIAANEPGSTLELVAETTDLASSAESLAAEGGEEIGEASWIAPDRQERRFACEHGLEIRLVRPYDEDERGELLPLPSRMEWEPAADLLARRVLRAVPVEFRDAARRRVTERAEALALADGDFEVTAEHAERGLLDATPEFQHESLRRRLADEKDALGESS